MSGGKGKTLFMVVRAGGDFGQQCVEIVDGCCVLCKRDPRFRLGDRRVAGLVFGKACKRRLGLVHPAKREQRLGQPGDGGGRSEEHTSELQSLMRLSYAVFCLKNKKKHT